MCNFVQSKFMIYWKIKRKCDWKYHFFHLTNSFDLFTKITQWKYLSTRFLYKYKKYFFNFFLNKHRWKMIIFWWIFIKLCKCRDLFSCLNRVRFHFDRCFFSCSWQQCREGVKLEIDDRSSGSLFVKMDVEEVDFSCVCRVCCTEGPTLPLFRVNLHRKVMACASVQVFSSFFFLLFWNTFVIYRKSKICFFLIDPGLAKRRSSGTNM